MTVPAYVTDCPNCGSELVHWIGDPQGAPWICPDTTGGCGRGWWPSELAADARLAWQPQNLDHAGGSGGHRFIAELHSRCLQDLADARERGCSALPECIDLMTPDQLESVVHVAGPRASLLAGAYTIRSQAMAALRNQGS